MRKTKLKMLVLSLMSLVVGIGVINAAEPKAATTSTCFLRNPPDSSVDWKFYGNQTVWVSLENGNVLGVTATLGLYNAGKWEYKQYVIAPFYTTEEKAYSIFGNPPIIWNFSISTASDAALITGHARWNSF